MTTLSKTVALALILELYEFDGDLTDTRENIEAPFEQLSLEGQLIITDLKHIGITNREEVDKLAEELNKTLQNKWNK